MSDPKLVEVPFELLDALETAIQTLESTRRAVLLAYQREPWDGPLPVHEARNARDEAEKTVQERVGDLLHPHRARLIREENEADSHDPITHDKICKKEDR